ncbi:S8 family serine peptidase [Metabacillus sp. 113a]|uniref:S8 family serine peptidase n=1 Tax=Metabacillus sp. 113a TaxID=3404706 RepID=UPI003CE76FCD
MKRKIVAFLILGLMFLLVIIINLDMEMREGENTHSKVDIDYDKKQYVPWGVNLIGNIKGANSKVVKVAILDSGIEKAHPDLEGKVVKEFNATDPDNPSRDVLGHGTAVAGIITANDNDRGILGVTQNVEIYSVKVIKDDGKIDREHFLNGLAWAISQNVDVINLSLGFQKNFPELQKLVETAINKGIIVVAASGNAHGMNSQYPARYHKVISVGAVDKNLKPTNFTATGKVDFVAPGVDILSINRNGYSHFDGTSFSVGYITGIVAEILSRESINKNEKIVSDVKEQLEKMSSKSEINKSVGHGVPKFK